MAGFTLLEMMIGLALLALIMLLLFAALRLAATLWDAGEQKLQASSAKQVVSSFVRRSLGSTYPWRFSRDGSQVLAFEGGSEEVRYAGNVPTRQGVPGLYLVALGHAEDKLIIKWAQPNTETEDFSILDDVDEVTLLEDVGSIQLAYFGVRSAGEDPAWGESWDSERYLPELVRIQVAPKNGPPWPAIDVAPMLSVNANCVWDDFYKRCRTLAEPEFVPKLTPTPAVGR